MPHRRTLIVALATLASMGVGLSCSTGNVGSAPVKRDTGELTKPIEQMTAREMWDAGYALKYSWGPEQARKCGGTAQRDCVGRVDAVIGVRPDSARRSQFGTIVARFANDGQNGDDRGPENKYNTEKSGLFNARRYYLVERHTATDGWSWVLVEGRKANDTVVIKKSGTFVYCREETGGDPHPTGNSEFWKCPTPGGPAPKREYDVTDPGWLKCMEGCCTAGQ